MARRQGDFTFEPRDREPVSGNDLSEGGAVCVREEELELWVVVPPGQGHSLSEEGSDNLVSTPRLSQTAQVQATVSRRAPVPPALK